MRMRSGDRNGTLDRALTHNEGVSVEAVLMKWLARVPSPSLLLFKVHLINVGKKEMIPGVCFTIKKQRTMSLVPGLGP